MLLFSSETRLLLKKNNLCLTLMIRYFLHGHSFMLLKLSKQMFNCKGQQLKQNAWVRISKLMSTWKDRVKTMANPQKMIWVCFPPHNMCDFLPPVKSVSVTTTESKRFQIKSELWLNSINNYDIALGRKQWNGIQPILVWWKQWRICCSKKSWIIFLFRMSVKNNLSLL